MDLLDRLLKHDAWTTAQLLECSLGLSHESLDQRFEIGHKTVRATFIHIIGNMRVWVDLMSGTQRSRPCLTPDITVVDLRKSHDEIAQELYGLGRDIVDHERLNETFIDTLDSPPRRKSLGAGLLHLATHSMHHRAQLLFMLRRLDVKGLPEGDAMSWENQHVGGWEET